MADKDNLTPAESATLIVLMAEAREISNVDMKARYGITLDGQSRLKLNGLGLVASRKVGRAYVHLLEEKGWARVHQELDFDSPKARAIGAALVALHRGLLGRVLPRQGHSFAELFSVEDLSNRQAKDPALESWIRSAYFSLAVKPGAWVSLAALRAELAISLHDEVSSALQRLSVTPGVSIVPESNQKTLSDKDRSAAVNIGRQDKHLLAIEER